MILWGRTDRCLSCFIRCVNILHQQLQQQSQVSRFYSEDQVWERRIFFRRIFFIDIVKVLRTLSLDSTFLLHILRSCLRPWINTTSIFNAFVSKSLLPQQVLAAYNELPQHAFVTWIHWRVSGAVPRLSELLHVRQGLDDAVPIRTVVMRWKLFPRVTPQLQPPWHVHSLPFLVTATGKTHGFVMTVDY